MSVVLEGDWKYWHAFTVFNIDRKIRQTDTEIEM